jgi:hypothetical protein
MFKINFNLHFFGGELEASHEVIKNIPDFVTLERDLENDYNGSRGNLIDYTEAYTATAEKPFSIIVKEIVTYGDRNGNEYTLKAEEVKTTVVYEVYWNNNSGDLVSLYNQIRHLIHANIIKYDFDSSTYTVPADFTDQFLSIVKENNCTAEIEN